MKHFSCSLIILLFSMSFTQANSPTSLRSQLLSTVLYGGPQDQYSACILLAELPFSSSFVAKLRSLEINNNTQLLCLSYLLAKRSMEQRDEEAFITQFSVSEEGSSIWQKHELAGYPLGLLPPQVAFIIEKSKKHDRALILAIQLYLLADGVFAESLGERLAELLIVQPARIEQALRLQDVKADKLNFILEVAEFLRVNGTKYNG